MTDSELKVGLAFQGISCVEAFAILLYMRRKAEEASTWVYKDFLLCHAISLTGQVRFRGVGSFQGPEMFLLRFRPGLHQFPLLF